MLLWGALRFQTIEREGAVERACHRPAIVGLFCWGWTHFLPNLNRTASSMPTLDWTNLTLQHVQWFSEVSPATLYPSSRPPLCQGSYLSEFPFSHLNPLSHCLSALRCRARTANVKYLFGRRSAPGIQLQSVHGLTAFVSQAGRGGSASAIAGGRVGRWRSHKVDEGCSLAWDCVKARDKALWSSAPEIREFTFYCCIIWVRAWNAHCQTPPLAC